jgi:biotin operon repressor
MNGYVRAWRSLVDWEWYKDTNTKCLFLHLLLTANHSSGRWEGMAINPGQLITSSSALAKAIGLSRQNVRTALTKLKSTSEITIKSTNQYILITIEKWAFYQSDTPLLTSDLTIDSTSDQPATNQRLTTNKKDKKEKNEKNINTASLSALDLSFVDPALIKSFMEFVEHRKTIKRPLSKTSAKKSYDLLMKMSDDTNEQIAIIDQSIANGWQGLFDLKNNVRPQQPKKGGSLLDAIPTPKRTRPSNEG